MMSSPFPTLFICLFYAYFSKVIGPKLMENRKPFNLRNILIGYNFVQTIFSAWIFYEVSFSLKQEKVPEICQFDIPTIKIIIRCFLKINKLLIFTYLSYCLLQFLMSGWWGSYSFRCQPVDYSNNPMALRVNIISLQSSLIYIV